MSKLAFIFFCSILIYYAAFGFAAIIVELMSIAKEWKRNDFSNNLMAFSKWLMGTLLVGSMFYFFLRLAIFILKRVFG